MQEKDLVSVIMPVYNASKYVEQSVKSICDQTYDNLEIILVDNGSTDGSYEILRELGNKDGRIKVMQDLRPGPGPTRDVGVKISNGDWICFLDSDDLLHSRFIEIMLSAAKRRDSLMSRCRYLEFRDNETVNECLTGVEIRYMEWHEFYYYLFSLAKFGASPFGIWAALYHRSVVKGFRYGDINFAEDSYMSPKYIYKAGKHPIAVVDEYLYFYRVHEISQLRSGFTLRKLDRFYAKDEVMKMWEQLGEREMYDLFFPDYYHCLVSDYLNMQVYLPEQSDNYKKYAENIRSKMDHAKKYHSGIYHLNPGARAAWNRLKSNDTGYIQYGYGVQGKRLYAWMTHLGIRISEVWDKAAKQMQNENLTLREPHFDVSDDKKILIAIENNLTALSIRGWLGQKGKETSMMYQELNNAVLYGMFEKHLPFLIEDYFD